MNSEKKEYNKTLHFATNYRSLEGGVGSGRMSEKDVKKFLCSLDQINGMIDKKGNLVVGYNPFSGKLEVKSKERLRKDNELL